MVIQALVIRQRHDHNHACYELMVVYSLKEEFVRYNMKFNFGETFASGLVSSSLLISKSMLHAEIHNSYLLLQPGVIFLYL
jgi:hypothetical protein